MSTEKSPFEIVFTKSPCLDANLTTLLNFQSFKAAKTVYDVQEMFKEVTEHLAFTNLKYKADEDKRIRKKELQCDLVMAHYGRGRTHVGTYSKLQDQRLGPFKIIH